jgi:NAD(P)-dependent dehydrogenase (short-subunit alcohol dehydrogenase family)
MRQKAASTGQEAAVFEGSIVVVTGAGRGIGAATARLLASRGARVALLSRSPLELESVAQEITHASGKGRALALVADVSDEEAVESAFAQVRRTWGPAHILVNNAGTIVRVPLAEMTVAQWDHVMAVNLRGSFLCARAAFRQMRDSGCGGSIVNISSLGGIRSTLKFEGFTAYVTSKHGVVGLTECLSVEGKSHGIRVNCVAPGAVDTQMLRSAAPFLKTNTQPEAIAELITYLCDDQKSHALTGAVIEVNCNE